MIVDVFIIDTGERSYVKVFDDPDVAHEIVLPALEQLDFHYEFHPNIEVSEYE